MITREEIIANPDLWVSTEKLNLDFFDAMHKNVTACYFLKQKNKDQVYYGNYEPEQKAFVCYKLRDHNELIIKVEDISFFLALPSIDFTVN